MKALKIITKNTIRVTRDIFDSYTPLQRGVYIVGSAISIAGVALAMNKKTRNTGLGLMAISTLMSIPLISPTVDASIASGARIRDEHIVDNILGDDAKVVFYWLHEKKWLKGGKIAIMGDYISLCDEHDDTVGMPIEYYHSVVRVYNKQESHRELCEFLTKELGDEAP